MRGEKLAFTCQHCGVNFTGLKSQGVRKYCSRDCKLGAVERVTFDCQGCGKQVQKLKSQAHAGMYCSNSCRPGRMVKSCEGCGQKFTARNGRRQRFCSRKCRPAPGLVDGRAAHPQYDRWYSMVYRCTSPSAPEWHNYGGRGIRVHREWQDDPFAFYAYLDTLGPCPPGYSLERIDNDGHYEPGNIRWASAAEQFRNRRPFIVDPSGKRRPPRLRQIDTHAWVIA